MPDNRSNVLSGPSTYAIQKPQPIQVQAPLATETARMGARPSEIAYRSAADNQREAVGVLQKVNQDNLRAMSAFSGAVQQKLKEVQENEFAEGYLRHAQGESVADIAKSQPFKQLFGDGGAVRGAQARQTENAGQSLLAYVQQNQGELINMTMDEQRQVIAKYVSDLSTGDAVADRMIGEGAIKMMPSILDNLTRSTEAEQQRKAAIAQADVMQSHADGLKYAQDQVAKGQMAPEHFDYLKAQLLEASRPLPGQSPESYRAALTGNVLSLTKNGQFEMANMIRQEALDIQLTPEERRQMDSQMKQANAEWLKDNPLSGDYMQFATQMPAQIGAGRYPTEAAVYADVDRFNNDYMLETGSTKPLIDNEQKGRMGAAWIQWNTQTEAQRQKAAQGEQDDFAKRASYAEGFAKGSPSMMAASGLDARGKASMEQNETTKFLNEEGNVSGITVGRLAVNGHVIAPLKEQLSGTLGILKGGGVPKKDDLVRLQTAYLKFMNTPYGSGAALAYFGDDLPIAQQMASLDMDKKENQQWIREQAQATAQPVKPSQEVNKAATDLVDSEIKPGWWSRTFGDAQDMGAGFETMMKESIQAQTAQLMAMYPNMPQEEILKMAATKVMERNDVAGNMLVTGGKKGEVFTELNKHLNIKLQTPTDTRINKIFNDGIRSRINTDFTIGSLNALPNGRMLATVVLPNGLTQPIPLSISDLATKANAVKPEEVAKKKALTKSYTWESGMTEAYKANEQRRYK